MREVNITSRQGQMGSADPPGKMDEKLKSKNMQKEQFSECRGVNS